METLGNHLFLLKSFAPNWTQQNVYLNVSATIEYLSSTDKQPSQQLISIKYAVILKVREYRDGFV